MRCINALLACLVLLAAAPSLAQGEQAGIENLSIMITIGILSHV